MNLPAECARPIPDAGRVRQAAAEVVDWNAVAGLAVRHAVAPLVYRHLSEFCPERVPESVLERLRGSFRSSAGRSLKFTAELLRLHSVFHDAGIDVVPFKGPVLAWSLYESPALREMNDLDLLVRPRDRERATGLLRAAGYLPSYPCGARFFEPGGEMPFASAATGVAVDLHWSLAPPQFRHGLDVAGVWSRLADTQVAGHVVRTLGPEDQLIFLCIHSAKHGWRSLHWLSDIARLAGRPGIDWEALVSRIDVRRTSRVVLAGLLLSADLLGASVPAAVLDKARTDASAVRIAAVGRSRLLAELPRKTTKREEFGFELGLLERPVDKLRSCRGQLLPQPSDYESFPLPQRLFPVYYALRPLRLAAKYFSAILWRILPTELRLALSAHRPPSKSMQATG